MSIAITIRVGGQPLIAELDEAALAEIAAAIEPLKPNLRSPYLSIPEAAEFLRCSRQRVDDLLSTRRLQRVKDGRRTLIARSDLDAYLA